MIRIATLAALTLLAFILANLGMDWIEFGQGLNPYIAFPISAIIITFVVRTIIMDIRHEMKMQRIAEAYRNARQ